MSSTRKVKICCATCRGENILFDAYAVWDVETQSKVLQNDFDHTDCEDCGGECSTVERYADTGAPIKPGKLHLFEHEIWVTPDHPTIGTDYENWLAMGQWTAHRIENGELGDVIPDKAFTISGKLIIFNPDMDNDTLKEIEATE